MKKTLGFSTAMLVRNKINSILLLFAVATVWIILLSNKNGAAKNGEAVTGAPFNTSRTCSRCHSGGNFGGSISTQLLDGTSTPVTQYTPGQSYTFRITMNHTIGTPKFGFQTTAATVSGSLNQNSWGVPPLQTQNQLLSGRNYLEQSTALTSGVISLPWTAPAAGKGSIIFYTSGNLVNGTGGTTGDQPVNTSLTVSEGTTLPVTITSFKGSVQNNAALLTWATAQEQNNKNFIIEKSYNGVDFAAVAQIPSKGNTQTGYSYSYTDFSFKYSAYYRLKQVDLDGKTTQYSIVDLQSALSIKYDLSVYGHAGSNYIRFYNGVGKQQKISILYTDLQGKRLYTSSTSANAGYNVWPIINAPANGILIVTIVMEDGTKISKKFLSVK